MAATVIVFAGEYDLTCREQLRKELTEAHPEPHLVLDLTEVSYVDSSFVTELVRLHRHRNEQDFDTEVIVLRHPTLHRLFDVLDLGKIFRVVGTLDEGLADNGDATSIRYAFSGRDGAERTPLAYQSIDRTFA